MDSFENEEEGKIIGTIVKLDSDSLQGVSDSPPRVTLKDTIVNPAIVVNQGENMPHVDGHTAELEGVMITSTTVNINDTILINSSANKCETSTQKELDPMTPVNTTLEGVSVLEGVPSETSILQMPEGVSSHVSIESLSKSATPVNTTLPASTLDSVTAKYPPKQQTNAPVSINSVTPESNAHNDRDTILPDLVNSSSSQSKLHAPMSNVHAAVGEFDFPALSSDDDNNVHTAPLNLDTCKTASGTEQVESQLTEEEDDTISALLSLSKSIPSDNSQDAIDNSDLLPIGKPTVDAAPVPIRLGTDDVNKEIDKLRKPFVNGTKSVDSALTQNQVTEVTITIIANQDGSLETETSIQSKPQKPVSLPTSPKLTQSLDEDSPGSP